ncbi:hypothetical protein ACFL1G_01810 [Planctomycetota bacterium]
MRNRFERFNSIFHFTGSLLGIFGLILFFPVIFVLLYWGQKSDGPNTLAAFIIPALLSFALGLLHRGRM